MGTAERNLTMEAENELRVSIPGGTLVAYPSIDPNNPGIFIDFEKDGDDCALNLSGTECQIDEDGKTCRLVTHVWGNGTQEDTTHDVEHENVQAYFLPEEGATR